METRGLSVIWIASTFKKVKDFCIKYWKALTALLLVLVGYVIGRRADTSKIDKEDATAKELSLKKQLEDIEALNNSHRKKRDDLFNSKERELELIEREKKSNIENLSNNEEKLDKILKDEHELKKGE